MSRSFLGFGQVAYIGTPYTRPITFGGIKGISVPLRFDWLSYGASTVNPNVNVLVDLSTQNTKALIEIRSVYIDNLGSDVPVYIYFEDTDYSVVAAPNSAQWLPVYTKSLKFWIVGLGFLTGNIPTTKVIVTNLVIEASSDVEIATSIALWKASATITRGSTIYNENLGTPALGDQADTHTGAFNSAGVMVPSLWQTPQPSGFLYVTNIDFTFISPAFIGAGGSTVVVVESTGISGLLYSFIFSGSSTILGVQKLLGLNGMNLKLDATQTWRLRCTSQSGVVGINFSFNSNFTLNPT